MIFDDRAHAGEVLAAQCAHLRDERPVVLALPRGGVPVGFEVARALGAPLDVIVVRKLGVPYQPELGMGAIGEAGVRVLNPDVIRMARVSETELEAVEARERPELERRAQAYRRGRPMVPVEGRTVIVVDDGIATGGTARAALQVARAMGAAKVVLAVPVAASQTLAALQAEADEVIAAEAPSDLWAVGAWYRDFRQTSDEEVVRCLEEAARSQTAAPSPAGAAAVDEEVRVPVDGKHLAGHLFVPAGAVGIVVFAHGSGSSRHSPRNRSVAEHFHESGLGTLLFDLLTEAEAVDRAHVFDIELLGRRLVAATEWLQQHPVAGGHAIGYFGASTGAGAALWAAAEPGSPVRAVVSRGGRPDLAGPRLGSVRAPVLLIVGGLDRPVLTLNQQAAAELRCVHQLVVVPGATHLFEEPGTLERVASLARDWFLRWLPGRP